MVTEIKHSWMEILSAEGIPLNCGLVFHLQNQGVNEILRDGRPLSISKKSKRSFAELVDAYRVGVLGGNGNIYDYNDINQNVRRNELTTITINFHDGAPTGQRAAFHAGQYFARRDRAAHMDSDADLGFSIEK